MTVPDDFKTRLKIAKSKIKTQLQNDNEKKTDDEGKDFQTKEENIEKLIEDVIENSSSSMYFTANNCHLENGNYVRCVKSEYHPSIVGTNILAQESATATLVGTELITTSIGIFECYKIKLNFKCYN